MTSLDDIKTDLLSRAETASIEGTAVDSLCSLLAYAIYKNQVIQSKLLLENSFTTSTSVNSKILYASELLYNVSRGKCPRISISTAIPTKTFSVSAFDYHFTFSGHYFYWLNDASYTINVQTSTNSPLEFICASKKIQECSVTDLVDTVYYIDFYDENISEDLQVLVLDTESGDYTIASYTTDSGVFSNVDSSGNYLYDYLLLTLPSYGVRLIRQSYSTTWGTTEIKISYIPYSESIPEFDSLRSIPSFTFVYDADDSSNSTVVSVTGYNAREEDGDNIWSSSVAHYLAQGTVATTNDLLALLQSIDSSANFMLYNNTAYDSDSGSTYTSYGELLVVYSGGSTTTNTYQSQVTSWAIAIDATTTITVLQATANSDSEVTLYVVVQSDALQLDQDVLDTLAASYNSWIGQDLHHSVIEADIVRLGFDSVVLYTDNTLTTEYTGTIGVTTTTYPSVNLTGVSQ